MSLLMDALRRAEADKKLQEERAARAAGGEASPESGLITRISPYSNAQDDTVQIDGRALQAAAASIADFDLRIDDNLDRSLSMTIAEGLSLEPLEGADSDAQSAASATNFGDIDALGGGNTTHGGRFERREQTGTLPSSRGMQSDLNDYFDRSHSREIPRAAGRASDGTLEDVAAHTVVGAQTVFRAGERVRGGRILALGAGIAACAVVAIAALGVYYAGLNPSPQLVPSPSVAGEVEKPLPRERPVASDAIPAEPARAELPRIDTQAPPSSSAAAPPASLVEESVTQPVSRPPDAAPAPVSPPATHSIAPPTVARSVSPAHRARAAPSPGGLNEEITQGEVQISRSRAPNALDATLAKAYAAFPRGDLDRAANLYGSAQVADPERRDTLLGLAAVALKRGDLPHAYDYYATVLKRHPDDPVASAALLGMTDTQGEAGAARLRLLLDHHRDAAYLHAALGRWYARQGRWADAQQAYFDAARLEAGNPDYAFNLAVALDHMGQGAAALTHYQNSLTLHQQRSAGFSTAAAQNRISALSALTTP